MTIPELAHPWRGMNLKRPPQFKVSKHEPLLVPAARSLHNSSRVRNRSRFCAGVLVPAVLSAAGLVAGKPSLAAPAPNCTYAQMITVGVGCSLTSGDKTVDKFTAADTLVPFPGPPAPGIGWEPTDFFTITNDGTIWTLRYNFTPGSLPTNALFASGYQLSITDPTKLLDTAKISYVGLGAPVISASISGGPTLNTGGPTTGTFSGAVSSSTVSYAFFVPFGSNLSSVTIELTQKDRPSGVPGPLPLAGAAAAFAYSRRMRARIRSAT